MSSENTQHCPYCNEDGKTQDHILDCQPFDINTV